MNRVRNEAENAKASANSIAPSNFYSGDAAKPITRSSPGDTRNNTIRLDDADSQPAPPQKISLPYPEGRVFRTHCTGLRRSGDDIQINELLAPNLLQRALLSAFQWDYHWIMSKLPLKRNPNFHMTLVMQGKEPVEREMMQQMFNGTPRVKLVFPNMEGQINCMHSKLMLLWMKRPKNTVGGSDGEEFLRIVVPTANLTDYDWGEGGGFMENMVFVIDLPKRSDPDLAFDQTFFHTELTRFCSHQGIDDSILTDVSYYDFSATRNMAFIHSIGGSHTGDAWDTTGITGLARAVRTLNLSSSNGLEIDYVTSSLGALKDQFLGDLYRACQGHSGLSDLRRRQKKPPAILTSLLSTTTPPPPQEEEIDPTRIRQRFNVYFPSRETVVRSKNGVNGGGTICFQEQWWNAPGMPKDVVKECISKREGMLMHNKILYARLPREVVLSQSSSTSTPEEPKKTYASWVYVGSSNLSESAWGKLVLDRSTKQPKLNIRNWECGVLLPVETPKPRGRTLGGDEVVVGMPMELEKVVEGRVPVPMKVPAGRVERPWFRSEM
ncbi:phospholipase D/nuclease [Ascodesmis nigricans]|uniref:Phospholipase D/nuclease n=1 Tax=Ascodesmis nigricans TaxID=341454 RepID=A0A4S2MWN7_9PEZI|nr:phospholipase D/nuclease [Ascodesmis nigricans]